MTNNGSKGIQSKKEKIINYAFDLFAEKGYSETSVDDIVKASGISKGGIYYYFKSKEDIFLEIAKDRLRQRHSIINDEKNTNSSKEKLISYIKWTLTGFFDERVQQMSRFTFEFWSVLSRNPNMEHKAKERYNMFYTILSEILEEGIRNGEFKKNIDIESMVYIILSTMDGIGFANSVMGIRMTEEVIENYIDMILKKIEKGD
ncbi:TetR/AcrR family transcriptional regulator [Tissierella sp. MB52-C2]|uniref:TetR/AcrR family transcriptional regulator n=1 Tax=Tissierella sp. MB52-C2 TaxID=3070999 RepID=UPI00280AF4D6|nr:TetR/AcrR family transcriptional regulator [Tissierella sp. MB52-C2]WMM24802.1 TetR/AcrR family transcriptional regulator [Tissierella sp. MB52-C2]